ncbi:MAG: hypothetical protein QM791_04115 [Ferruginibacter sp.]
MPDKVVAATLQVNTGTSNENIKEVNKNLNEVKSNLANTSAQAGKTGKDIESGAGSFGKLKSQIANLPGPLGQASQGVTSLTGAFKALLANPVGLILTALVGILTLLYKAFTNTFEGANKVEQVFAGIKATAQSLLDNLGKVASAIKNVFTFNFSGAKKDIEEVAGAAKKAFTEMSRLTAEAQKLKKEQLDNDLDQAEREKKLAILREQALDSDVPVKERIKLLRELKTASEENSKSDIDLAKRTAENQIAQLTLQKDGARKNQEEITKIKIEQIRVETDNANELRRIGKALSAAEKQEADQRKELLKEQADKQKEANEKYKEYLKEKKKLQDEQNKLQADFREAVRKGNEDEAKELEARFEAGKKEDERIAQAEADRLKNNEKLRLENRKKLAELEALNNPDDPAKKIALIQSNLELELQAIAEGDLQRQVLAKKASDEVLKIRQQEVDAKKQLAEVERQNEEAKVAAIGQTFGTLADLAGKQTVIGKTFAIIQTTIDTYQSAIAAYKSLAGIPVVGPALGAIAAAGAIKNGLDAVKRITAVQVPGGGGGSSAATPSLSAPAAPLAPQQRSTDIDAAAANNAGNAAQPVRAYVLDTDSIDNRERNYRLNRAAKLGG